jgi:hypothetical protein
MHVFVRNYLLKKKNILITTISISVLSCFFLVTHAFAATVSLTTSVENIAVGEVVPVEVWVDTAGASINVVEGVIRIESSGDVEMRELSVAGADLSLWTRKPSWNKENQSVSFVGGEPGGISGEEKLLFRMFVIPQREGEMKLVSEIKAYANDGQGTLIPIGATSLSRMIKDQEGVSRDGWRDTVAGDNTPPTILSAEIGSDPSLHEGKLFLVIRAEDAESGIERFEIKEGDRDPVRSGSEYVLQDQDESTKIILAVFDKAGNVQLMELSPLQKSFNRNILYSGLIFGVILALGITIAIKRKNKKRT